MSDVWTLLAMGAVGIGLGVVFFGGLMLTTARLARCRRPMLWMLASFVVRTGAVVAAFVWLARWRWQFVAVAMLGFVLTRFLFVRIGLAAGRRSAACDAPAEER